MTKRVNISQSFLFLQLSGTASGVWLNISDLLKIVAWGMNMSGGDPVKRVNSEITLGFDSCFRHFRWRPLHGTPLSFPAHGCRELRGEGKRASVTEWRLAVGAGPGNILILGAPDSSIRHRRIWCSVKSSRKNVFDTVQKRCTDGTQITFATHSSKFGSRPSAIILFLMAMTGTPCNGQKAWWNVTPVKFSPIT